MSIQTFTFHLLSVSMTLLRDPILSLHLAHARLEGSTPTRALPVNDVDQGTRLVRRNGALLRLSRARFDWLDGYLRESVLEPGNLIPVLFDDPTQGRDLGAKVSDLSLLLHLLEVRHRLLDGCRNA